jgi:hypothetical protein
MSLKYNQPLDTVMLAGVFVALHHESGDPDVVIETIVHNRRRETINVMANMAVVLPLHAELTPQLSMLALIEHLARSIQEMKQMHNVPPSACGLMDVRFQPRQVQCNIISFDFEPGSDAGSTETRDTWDLPEKRFQIYDLMIDIESTSAAICGNVAYAELIDRPRCEVFVRKLEAILRNLAEDPSRTVGELLASVRSSPELPAP